MRSKLSDEVYNDLKEKILRNQLRPGDMICETELVERYHMSRTPVRQALQQLSAMGLVEIRDGVGSFVSVIARDEMESAYQIRLAIEKIAIQTSIDRIGKAELDELEEKFLRFAKQLARGGYGVSFEEMIRADWALHDLIVSRSENRLLQPTAEKITLLLRRYQFAYVSGYSRATQEHLEIVRGIRNRDIDGVIAVLEEHLRMRPL